MLIYPLPLPPLPQILGANLYLTKYSMGTPEHPCMPKASFCLFPLHSFRQVQNLISCMTEHIVRPVHIPLCIRSFANSPFSSFLLQKTFQFPVCPREHVDTADRVNQTPSSSPVAHIPPQAPNESLLESCPTFPWTC